MNPTLLLAAILSAAPGSAPPDARSPLMPVPARMTWQTGQLRLDSLFSVTAHGPAGDARLARAIERFRARLGSRTGLMLRGGGAGLTLEVAGPGEAVQSLTENESYTLAVRAGGVQLSAATTVGALRGLETLLQLIQSDSAGWFLPQVEIDDAPRFPWRGLMIDVGRHFEPVEAIKRQIDGMAAVKLNVLHWHLSEDQGFRVQSLRYPKLSLLGSDGQFYTQEQLRDVVAYARDRGIRVVPEFDMPGHASAWFVGYPEYASAPGPYAIERNFGAFPPAFDPTRESTFAFIDAFIGEMAAIFPDHYWHIGGDEVVAKQWRENPRIRRFMAARHLANNDALQAYFNQRLSKILTRHHKRMVGWDEILHPDLPATTVVQSWRGQKSLSEGARKGFSGILSWGYYLDHMETAEYHYLVDPLPEGSTLTPEQAARILGGEACMWHEHVTPASIDSRIWPRMAVIAERFWSPRDVRDVPDMYRRLSLMRIRLEELGLDHEGHLARMARQLGDGANVEPLITLLDLMAPVSLGERVAGQKVTTLTPLVFAVDAARPEPPAHWATRTLAVAAVAGDSGARRQLRDSFAAWLALAPAIDSLALHHPLAQGAAPAARALSRISVIGQEALDQLERGPATADWVKTRKAQLDSLYKPQGLLRVMIVPAVRLLVDAAAPR